MTEQKQPDNQIRKTLYEERVATGTHNYFIEVKLANNGSKYLVIDQKKKKAGSQYEGAKMRIFEDEMLEFQRILGKMIHIAHNYETSSNIELNNREELNPKQSIIFSSDITYEEDLYPAFYKKLLSTHNWEEFEQYTYYLLKLIGIHTAYKFLGERQAGKADGFFKFCNLAVIYDCTLDHSTIDENKKEQIINYCNRLKLGSIELSGNAVEEFHSYYKQVWIITRGTTRTIKLINDIVVKEISIQQLMQAYLERLKYPSTNEQLEFKLRNF